MKMTYSAILRDRDNKKVVQVLFERVENGKKEIAEGVLPECRIIKQNGYSESEVSRLEEYLKENLEDIMGKAKMISNPLKWL